MLELDTLEIRSGPIRALGGNQVAVPQLHAGPVCLATNLGAMDWSRDPTQFEICGCGQPGCQPGGYLSLRRAGRHVLMIPPVGRWHDEFAVSEFAPPEWLATDVAAIVDGGRFEAIASGRPSGRPDIPLARELPRLTYGEAIAVWWLAGLAALGQAPVPLAEPHCRRAGAIARGGQLREPALDAALVLATSPVDPDEALATVDAVLASVHGRADDPAEVVAGPAGIPLEFVADTPAATAWQALTIDRDRQVAMLSPEVGIRVWDTQRRSGPQ